LNDAVFRAAKAAIDTGIEGWIGRPAGITMGFELIAEFSRRELLDDVEYLVAGETWKTRRYRGRIVQPDPELEPHGFFFGMRVFEDAE